MRIGRSAGPAVRRMLAVTVAVIAGGALLTACSGPASSGPPSSTSATAINRDGSIRLAAYSIPTTMDPHKTSGLIQNPVLFLAYDRLIHLTPDAKEVPGLATSWTYASDGKSLTLKLRPKVVYQDGEPFTAQSVKDNLMRAKTVVGTAVNIYLASVESIDVVDPLTVRLNLNRVDYTIPDSLALDAGAMVCPKMFNDPSLANVACGAGMYKQDGNLDPNKGATFSRWKGYWDPQAVAAAHVDVTLITDDNTRFAALQAGQADAIGILPTQIDQAKKAGFKTYTAPEAAYGSLVINPDVIKPLKDPNVREALSLAIDRDAIVQALAQGQGQATIQPVSINNPAYDPSAPKPTVNDAKAKQLLAKAGYPDGFDMGTVYSIGGALRDATLAAIAGQLEKVGITMKVGTVTFAQLVTQFYTNGTMGASYGTSGAGLNLGSGLIAANLPDSSFNPGHVTDQKFVDMFNSTLSEKDPAKRQAIYKQMSGYLATHPLNTIPIYFPVSGYAATSKVIGLATPKLGVNFVEWRGVGISK